VIKLILNIMILSALSFTPQLLLGVTRRQLRWPFSRCIATKLSSSVRSTTFPPQYQPI